MEHRESDNDRSFLLFSDFLSAETKVRSDDERTTRKTRVSLAVERSRLGVKFEAKKRGRFWWVRRGPLFLSGGCRGRRRVRLDRLQPVVSLFP